MKYEVATILRVGVIYRQVGRDLMHAREMAANIMRDGLWVEKPAGEASGVELFYPPSQVLKVKIIPVVSESSWSDPVTKAWHDYSTDKGTVADQQIASLKESVDLLTTIVKNLTGDRSGCDKDGYLSR